MRFVPLAAFALLVACATPQEACINAVTEELRLNAQFIAETEATIARGFALRPEQRVREVDRICTGTTESGEPVRTRCEEVIVRTVQVPVAVDLNAERAKLASLVERRTLLQSQAAAKIAQCRAQYPAS